MTLILLKSIQITSKSPVTYVSFISKISTILKLVHLQEFDALFLSLQSVFVHTQFVDAVSALDLNLLLIVYSLAGLLSVIAVVGPSNESIQLFDYSFGSTDLVDLYKPDDKN